MKRIIAGFILFGAFTTYYGQQPTAKPAPPAKAEAPKPPTISDAQKLKFFKAQAELANAQANAQQASNVAHQKQAAFQTVIKQIADTCGKDFQPSLDPQGDPACVAKVPEPAKK